MECLQHFYETVIAKRRASHGLKEFVVQSDNGEFKSDAILRYLHSVGGDRRTCCAYTPEVMAFIERLWGIINSMASAMLIDKGLSEEYWEFAQNYALDIYNNIPPTRTPKGQEPKSPNEKYDGKNEDTSLYKVFGCRAFANIPKQVRRKNHNARAIQGMFIGIDRSSYPGYMIYSPEFHTVYVTGNVTFHQNLRYDGSLAKYQAAETVKKDASLPIESVDRYKYLIGTSHIDPDNGLLYKVMRVEEKNYRGQGTYIVAYRAQVLSDGRISTKCDRDAYHIRDIEEYYNTYMATILDKYPQQPRQTRSNNKLAGPDDRDGLSTEHGSGGASSTSLGKRKRTASVAMSSDHLPLYYDVDESFQSIRTASVCHVELVDTDSHEAEMGERELYIESAMCGDPIAGHCMATGADVSPDEREPNTIKQAFALPDRAKWREAVEAELDQIKQFNVFSEPMPLPPGKQALPSRWVFKRKRDHLGNIVKYKARLTPQGCYQHFGSDYADTYAPVARMATLRYVLALACLLGLQTSSCDFTNAFLNAELQEDVYVDAPPGSQPLPQGYVYKLQRALYGLKQSPREWNSTLNRFMTIECGFTQLKCEKCMYIKKNKDGSYMLVCMYVDDLVIAYSHRSMLESFLGKVKTRFKITQSDSLQKTLGFQIERTQDGGVFMHQQLYITEVLKRFGMDSCKPADTPFAHDIRLCKSGQYKARTGVSSSAAQGESTVPASTSKKNKQSSVPGAEPKVPYRELIGCLLWISMGTRPDISYAVNQCARYSADPKPEHWTACLRVLRYLKGTSDYGLHYHRHPTHYLGQSVKSRPAMSDLIQPFSFASSYYPGDSKVHIFGYSDSDYANDVDSRRSVTGYVFVFAGAPLSWNSMTQHSVALSTMEAEYIAVCKATQEAIYLRMLFEESGMKVDTPLIIKEDNQACISFTKQPGDHSRTKHIDVRSCFVRQWVEHGELILESVDTKEQLADIFTKALDVKQFQFLRDHLVRVRSSVMI